MSESLPCLKGEPTGGFFPTAPAGHAGPALQSAALSGRADRGVRPYKPIRRGRCLHRPAHRTTNNASVGAGGCSPSCPRIGWHFLETGSLLPPLAVLRRFPRLREGQSPSPTHSLLRFRRAGCPHPAARSRTALLATCHCEASAHTGCGNPYSPRTLKPTIYSAAKAPGFHPG